jgi:hypothetical protein
MSNHIKSYRFSNDELSLINNIKKTFKENGFGFDLLPEIYYCDFCEAQMIFDLNESEMPEKDFIFNPDYLGVYSYSATKEGIIILYRDRILKTACVIHNDKFQTKYSLDEVIKLLKAKVLIHELGHWLTHCCSLVNKTDVMTSFSFFPKIIKESMAQLTVLWSFLNHTTDFEYKLDDFSRVFIPMQPYPYYEFSDIKHLNSPEIILKRYWGLASQPTHLSKNNLFELLSKKQEDLTDVDKSILAGKSY